MMIPFGILSAAGVSDEAGTYELINTQILGTASASISFDVSTFASTYKHLQIRIAARDTNAANGSFMRLRFNGLTSNLTAHYLNGNGSSVTSGFENTGTAINFGGIPAGNSVANSFGGAIVDILDAFSSTKNTTTRSLDGYATNTGQGINLRSGLWNTTTAVSSVEVVAGLTSFAIGSRFSIYGIRG
jgi:hypothetical protein